MRPDGPRCARAARAAAWRQYAGEEARAAGGRAATGSGDRAALRAAAAGGDPAALTALEEAGAALGIALSGAVNLLDPQAVVLGGPLADLAPWLLPACAGNWRGGSRSARGGRRRWVSALGRGGPLLGAALVTVRHILENPTVEEDRSGVG